MVRRERSVGWPRRADDDRRVDLTAQQSCPRRLLRSTASGATQSDTVRHDLRAVVLMVVVLSHRLQHRRLLIQTIREASSN